MIPIESFGDSIYAGYLDLHEVCGDSVPDDWFHSSLDKFVFSPDHIIREAVPFRRTATPMPNKAGIYFLLQDEEIVYVGQATYISHRLDAHWDRGRPFNRVWCFGGMPKLYVDDIEAYYINGYGFPWNVSYPPVRDAELNRRLALLPPRPVWVEIRDLNKGTVEYRKESEVHYAD